MARLLTPSLLSHDFIWRETQLFTTRTLLFFHWPVAGAHMHFAGINEDFTGSLKREKDCCA